MLTYPNIDPVAIDLFGLKVHWYGLMYVAAFAMAYLLAKYRVNSGRYNWTMDEVSDLLFYGMVGVIFGGRIGYFIFYQDPSVWMKKPWEIFMIQNGGMSFHGGLIGVTLGGWYFSRKFKRSVLEVGDFLVPLVPLGLAFGRIGNFINGELWGRVTSADFPLAMIFPGSDGLPRHPSQLYQASLEGLLLFIVLWWYSSKPRPLGTTSALFLVGYGIARFSAEFVRQPDAQLNFIFGDWMTMGHVLSTPMIIGGIIMFAICSKQQKKV